MEPPIVINVQNSPSSTKIAAACTVVATILTFLQVRDHLRLNPNSALRVHVNRVLLMCPIYAWTSFLSTTIGYSLYFDTCRDCYEAFVIYSFFKFMSIVLGETHTMIATLQSKPQQNHIFPFKCLPKWAMGETFLRNVQFGILQYVVLKPLMGLAALILGAIGVYRQGVLAINAGFPYVAFVVNCSQIWAIYCLIIMYLAFAEDLHPIRPIPKMLCIKGLIFFTFWQSLLITILVAMDFFQGTQNNIARFEDLIICMEMVAFAIAHRWAFPSADFAIGQHPRDNITTPMLRSLWSAADVTDVFHDLRGMGSSSAGVKAPEEQKDMVSSSATVFVAQDPFKRAAARSPSPCPPSNRQNQSEESL